mgnify:CR=1 FL=1
MSRRLKTTTLPAHRAVFLTFLMLTAATASPVGAGSDTAPPEFVAGLDPSRRPAAVPTLTAAARPPGWRERAVYGIGEPTTGLRFVDDQGGWYTPFMLPGMTDRYDLRGWHHRPHGLRNDERR